MVSPTKSRSWRRTAGFVVGALLAGFVFAPFPGLGLIYPIKDVLRGHPQGSHGTHPKNFVGLWVRDEYIEFDFIGQAFYLMPDGRLAGKAGMNDRRWHFDNGSLFVDSRSLCGNCYQGNVTSEFVAKFVDADQLQITNKNKDADRGISGLYRRVEITDSLKADLNLLQESKDMDESVKSRSILRAIEMFEFFAKQEG